MSIQPKIDLHRLCGAFINTISVSTDTNKSTGYKIIPLHHNLFLPEGCYFTRDINDVLQEDDMDTENALQLEDTVYYLPKAPKGSIKYTTTINFQGNRLANKAVMRSLAIKGTTVYANKINCLSVHKASAKFLLEILNSDYFRQVYFDNKSVRENYMKISIAFKEVTPSEEILNNILNQTVGDPLLEKIYLCQAATYLILREYVYKDVLESSTLDLLTERVLDAFNTEYYLGNGYIDDCSDLVKCLVDYLRCLQYSRIPTYNSEQGCWDFTSGVKNVTPFVCSSTSIVHLIGDCPTDISEGEIHHYVDTLSSELASFLCSDFALLDPKSSEYDLLAISHFRNYFIDSCLVTFDAFTDFVNYLNGRIDKNLTQGAFSNNFVDRLDLIVNELSVMLKIFERSTSVNSHLVKTIIADHLIKTVSVLQSKIKSHYLQLLAGENTDGFLCSVSVVGANLLNGLKKDALYTYYLKADGDLNNLDPELSDLYNSFINFMPDGFELQTIYLSENPFVGSTFCQRYVYSVFASRYLDRIGKLGISENCNVDHRYYRINKVGYFNFLLENLVALLASVANTEEQCLYCPSFKDIYDGVTYKSQSSVNSDGEVTDRTFAFIKDQLDFWLQTDNKPSNQFIVVDVYTKSDYTTIDVNVDLRLIYISQLLDYSGGINGDSNYNMLNALLSQLFHAFADFLNIQVPNITCEESIDDLDAIGCGDNLNFTLFDNYSMQQEGQVKSASFEEFGDEFARFIESFNSQSLITLNAVDMKVFPTLTPWLFYDAEHKNPDFIYLYRFIPSIFKASIQVSTALYKQIKRDYNTDTCSFIKANCLDIYNPNNLPKCTPAFLKEGYSMSSSSVGVAW